MTARVRRDGNLGALLSLDDWVRDGATKSMMSMSGRSTPEAPQSVARLPPILWGDSDPALSNVRSGRESVCAGAEVQYVRLFWRDEADHQSFVE